MSIWVKNENKEDMLEKFLRDDECDDHKICFECGLCITCGQCEFYGCGPWGDDE